MDVAEIRPGLYRWTARHPGWVEGAEPESPADWPPDVGSVAYLGPDALAVIDPLVPAGGWDWLDRTVRSHGLPVSALTTLKFHRRSRDQVADRYGATTSRARDALPEGVEAIPIRGVGETMFWIAEHRALVPGDRLLGDGRGGLRLCPESWLGYLSSGIDLAELRRRLRPLLDLPVEIVLTSHGRPVLSGGRRAVAAALAL